jgi:ATP diphosphatase
MTNKITQLLEIMAALRTPATGCPWDLEQTFATIAPYTIEEAYEVADAAERGDIDDLKEELGDLLLQVVFHARMAEEAGDFAFDDVVEAISEKLIRRHPHVFGDSDAATAGAVALQWSAIKAQEKEARAKRRKSAGGSQEMEKRPSLLEGAPLALPALTRAVKLQERASEVGFDWANARLVLDKVRDETEEIAAEIPADPAEPMSARVGEEIGDLLFVVANLARHAGVDPEQALRGANAKFERRFHHIEGRLAEADKAPADSSLEEMEALWLEAKTNERKAKAR